MGLHTYRVIYNPYNQTAARACSDVLAIPKLSLGDLEAIATGTRVMEHFFDVIPRHVLDFYLVVVCSHAGSDGPCVGRKWRWLKSVNTEEIAVGVTPDHVRQRIK